MAATLGAGEATGCLLFGWVATLDFETALLAGFFDGAGLRAGAFGLAKLFCLTAAFLPEATTLPADFFAGAAAFAAGFAGFADFFGLLAGAAFDLVALRAGAFSAGERLSIGLGRADFSDNARLLAEDVVEARRVAGLEGDLLIPFKLGSLMRSSQLSKKAARKARAAHRICAQLNTALRLNQR